MGKLPLCEGAAEEHGFEAGMTVNELRENRSLFNQKVLSAVKELPFSSDIIPQVLEDFELGAMSQPRPLEPADMQRVSLTRRIPVRELRSKGWRTRVVDHETESGINGATTPADKIKHDTLDVLAEIVLLFFGTGHDVRMWKRDKHSGECPSETSTASLRTQSGLIRVCCGLRDTKACHSELSLLCMLGTE